MLNNLLNRLKNGKDKVFYKINEESITYEECYNKVQELAESLKKQGNSPVIVYGHKSIEQVISILACLIAKRCYIPIDLCTPIIRIKEIIKQVKGGLVIKNNPLKIENIECLTLEEINIKYKNQTKYFTTNNKYAYIIFTSGSTGVAKGVPITYENLNNFIEWTINHEELKKYKECNVLSQASFSFDLSVMDLYFSIYKKCSIIAVDGDTKNNLKKMYEVLKNEQVDFLILTPTFVKMLLLDVVFNYNEFPNIKSMFFCGECLEVETIKKIKERFPDINILNAYGPTEATCFVSILKIKDSMLNNKFLPVGKLSNSAVNISLNDNEIILNGKSVFSGYLNLNSKNYFLDKYYQYYKTGDIGQIEGDFLYCLGRRDNQIKYQGYRIELLDIENNLLKINGIREAVVICKYKEENIVRLIKAFVTVKNEITELQIKEELSKLVPSYMIPKKIEILKEIPVTYNGKYDRKKLINL